MQYPRSRSGCELIPIERAASRLGEILAAGGTAAIVADHHEERRGMPVISSAARLKEVTLH